MTTRITRRLDRLADALSPSDIGADPAPRTWLYRPDGSARPAAGGEWISAEEFAELRRSISRLVLIPDNQRNG